MTQYDVLCGSCNHKMIIRDYSDTGWVTYMFNEHIQEWVLVVGWCKDMGIIQRQIIKYISPSYVFGGGQ